MSDPIVNGADGQSAPSWRERQNVLLAGAVALAVVLGIGAYFLVFAGSSEDVPSGPVASAAGNSTAAQVDPSATPTAASTLPAAFEGDPYGNPFEPLYPAAPTEAPPSDAPAPSTDLGAAGGGGAVDGGAVPNPAPPGEPAPVETTKESVTVKLVKIVDIDTVTVSVNGQKAYAVDRGVVFADVFSLENTRPDEGEATFNYGDGEQFGLYEGQVKKIVVAS